MALKTLVTSACFMVDRGLWLSQGQFLGHQSGRFPSFPYSSRRPALAKKKKKDNKTEADGILIGVVRSCCGRFDWRQSYGAPLPSERCDASGEGGGLCLMHKTHFFGKKKTGTQVKTRLESGLVVLLLSMFERAFGRDNHQPHGGPPLNNVANPSPKPRLRPESCLSMKNARGHTYVPVHTYAVGTKN